MPTAPTIQVHHGDMLAVLKGLPKESVDAVVCDPPYGISFMSKEWDHEVPDARYWRRCWHRLKPGGYLVAFSSARTYHRLACAIEDAGFELRDQLMWLYGQGMPKSLNVGKAIDKLAGAERPVLGTAADFAPDGHKRRTDGSHQDPHAIQGGHRFGDRWSAPVTGPATAEAQHWDDWGTALKGAHEPIVLARKPLSESTVVKNVLRWGTGALNIGGCRVPWGEEQPSQEEWNRMGSSGAVGGKSGHLGQNSQGQKDAYAAGLIKVPPGRWPANVVHDGSQEVLEQFPDAKGQQGALTGAEPSGRAGSADQVCYGKMDRRHSSTRGVEECKSAARFFYCAKATAADRAGSTHPTVKPVALMRYLVRLVTPPGGVVLDPFAGSGTTGEAALAEGHPCILVERDDVHAAQLLVRFAGRTAPVEIPA